MEAASAVIAERGYTATTMAEIATRAGAPIGSLYRFFPSKDVLADALRDRYMARAAAAYDELEGRVGQMTADVLADALADFMVTLQTEAQGLSALLDVRGQASEERASIQTFSIKRIAGLLRLKSATLDGDAAEDLAILQLNVMKLMVAMRAGDGAPTSLGAVEHLRAMNRLYLSAKLRS